jgi:hypothetical protein
MRISPWTAMQSIRKLEENCNESIQEEGTTYNVTTNWPASLRSDYPIKDRLAGVPISPEYTEVTKLCAFFNSK